ncbi:fibulin-1 isoform X2 [Lingula anatina]|uniref:Fibulin-1 n=1 Tax=Lingula anatina TaxID=7574 RepID=A0A1S3HBL4_LINAN|nr:fibulin-1 isoform X2 [Lingula anatina]|eukprot:XP_013382916.1 fibulin-1 isoform X2 [Lingula anatina]
MEKVLALVLLLAFGSHFVSPQISEADDQMLNLLERCCDLGKYWQGRGLCDNYPKPIGGVPIANETVCMGSIRLCCVQKQQQIVQCSAGRQVAQRTNECAEIGNGESNEKKDCCNCCKLGLLAHNIGARCDTTSFDTMCDVSFRECCQTGKGTGSGVGSVTDTTRRNNGAENTNPVIKGHCELYPNRLCAHICISTQGSFRCECREGFELAADRRNCRPARASSNIANNNNNNNNNNNGNLQPTNNCQINNPCEHRCVDTGQAVRCECYNGYELARDEISCTDINECRRYNPCAQGQECQNSLGSYRCIGLSGNIPLVPSTECTLGYQYNPQSGNCEDVNECVNGNSCPGGSICSNTIGSYQCTRERSCGTGYTLNGQTNMCEDIDECAKPETNNCGTVFECVNIPGSFRCKYKTCPVGYRLNGQTGNCDPVYCRTGMKADPVTGQCVDINECEAQGTCSVGQICENTFGSYRCRDKCTSGYEADANGICRDIDECARGTANCPPGQQCLNLPGSFQCQCGEGYEFNPTTRTCDDVDECTRYGTVCSLNSKCQNTPGSYECTCNTGFKRARNGRNCIDINECEESPGICPHSCINTWGSFQCTCREGFRLGTDGRTCVDIDECEEWADKGRLCIGLCQNTEGSYTCSCPAGYRMTPGGRICADIDECAEGSANCNGPNQLCINTRGSFKCNVIQCPQGFMRQGGQSSAKILTDDGVLCLRKACSTLDIECLLNQTRSVAFQYLSIPTVTRLEPGRSELLMSVQAQVDGYVMYPNVKLDILSGNAEELFELAKTTRTGGELRLIKPIRGPALHHLSLSLGSRNRAGYLVSKHIAFVTIDVSRYPF